MTETGGVDYLWFVLGLLVLTGLTVGLGRLGGIGVGLVPLTAMARAVVQLSALALILRGILAAPWTVVAFLVLMLSTASWTAGGRLRELPHGRRIAAIGVLAGAVVTLAVVFALRLVDLDVVHLIAVAGIVIGNCMTAATLSGRNFLRSSRERSRSAPVPGWPTRTSAARPSARRCCPTWTRPGRRGWSPCPAPSWGPSSGVPARSRPPSSSWWCWPGSASR